MRRSEINAALREAEALLAGHGVALPPFARWTPDRFLAGGHVPGVVLPRLGWDVTDFGGGDFARAGLTLFTLRNGLAAAAAGLPAKSYAEKVLIVRDGQLTPMHAHARKTEDIIHRAGDGALMVELGRAHPGEEAVVDVWTDGVVRHLSPGEPLELRAGESVTLVPGRYHSFWAEGGAVIAGEVSSLNDDLTDNLFLEGGARFATVDEDEPPYRLLVSDYPAVAFPGGSEGTSG